MNEQQQQNAEPLRPLADMAQLWENHERKPIPFDEAYQRVMARHAADGERKDVDINALRSWAFGSTDGKTMMIRPVPLPGRSNLQDAYPLRARAWGQLCSRINAPADYLGRMPAKVQMACVNWDLSSHKKDATLRLAGNEARALLSGSYGAVDDEFYLALVGDVLDKTGYRNDALVRVVASGPQTLLRVTIPGEAKQMKEVGDVIEHGIDIGNSEVGLRSIQVNPVTFRLVCLNGMRSFQREGTHRKIHRGDPERLRDWLVDAVPVAFAEAKGELDNWHKATEALIDNALAEIEGLHSFGFTKPERELIGKQLVADTDLPGRNLIEQLHEAKTSVYNVANAITAAAQQRGVGQDDDNVVRIEPRLRFEEIASRYLHRRVA